MTRRHRSFNATLGLLFYLTGCALGPPDPGSPAVDTPHEEASHSTSPGERPGTAQAAAPTIAELATEVSEPTGVLTLPGALASVLARSPELTSFSWDIRAADAEVLQAGLRPNPEFSMNPENFVGSGQYASQIQFQNTLQLSQLIELGGKRSRRTDVAERARDKLSAEYEAKRVEVLAGTTVDFIELLSDQERLTLARTAVRQAEGTLAAAAKRVQAGVGSPLEEVRARVLLARARIVEEHTEHELLAARQNLAARWGGTEPLFTAAKGELYAAHVIPPLESLVARLASAPEWQVSVAEERVRTAEAALARTKQTPDVTLAAAWRHGRDWDDQSTVAAFSMPLQIFNRYQGEVAAAEAQARGATLRTKGIESRLRAVLFGLYQEILHAQAEMEAMRKEIVPRSEEALALARKGFGEGLFSQLDLLDAQRTLIEVRHENIQAAATFHRLVAEAERLLGEAL